MRMSQKTNDWNGNVRHEFIKMHALWRYAVISHDNSLKRTHSLTQHSSDNNEPELICTYTIIEWVITNCKYNLFYLPEWEQQHSASWWFCLFTSSYVILRLQREWKKKATKKHTNTRNSLMILLFLFHSLWIPVDSRSLCVYIFSPNKQNENEKARRKNIIHQSLTIASNRTNGITNHVDVFSHKTNESI